MATFKSWVRVPVDSSSSSKRPVEVTVEANSVADALAILRSQHGSENVVGHPMKISD
jgi:hypothetical protein